MVNAQKVEKTCLKKKNRDAKRARSCDGGNYERNFEIHDKKKFKKRFSNQFPSNFTIDNKERVPNPKPQGKKVVVHQVRDLIMTNVVRCTLVDV